MYPVCRIDKFQVLRNSANVKNNGIIKKIPELDEIYVFQGGRFPNGSSFKIQILPANSHGWIPARNATDQNVWQEGRQQGNKSKATIKRNNGGSGDGRFWKVDPRYPWTNGLFASAAVPALEGS